METAVGTIMGLAVRASSTSRKARGIMVRRIVPSSSQPVNNRGETVSYDAIVWAIAVPGMIASLFALTLR